MSANRSQRCIWAADEVARRVRHSANKSRADLMGFSVHPLPLRVDDAAHVPDLPTLPPLQPPSALGNAPQSHRRHDTDWCRCRISGRNPGCSIQQRANTADSGAGGSTYRCRDGHLPRVNRFGGCGGGAGARDQWLPGCGRRSDPSSQDDALRIAVAASASHAWAATPAHAS